MTKAEKKYNSVNPDPQNTSQILVCLALVLPLAAYLWSGSTMRYSGDEYFYGYDQNKQGFISHQLYSYQRTMINNGNRYSSTLFSNLGDLFGPASAAVMPGLAILFWVTGLFLLLRELGKILLLKTKWLTRLALALFTVFMCICLAPSLLQDLYWRTAILTYLPPVVRLVMSIAILLAAGACVPRIAPCIVIEAQPMRSWAIGWDARHPEIRRAISDGESRLTCGLLPSVIPWIAEPSSDTHAWYNDCAAGWCGDKSISAVEMP